MTAHVSTLAVGDAAGIRQTLGEPSLTWREREPRLFAFGLLMLALMVPAALALGLDDRTLRGVNVWVKPMKFMAAVSLLALTTAWFVGHLEARVRQGRWVRLLTVTLIASGGFEVAYITGQAALGQASHYNVGDAFHGLMYTLMGIGAMLLTSTQLLLGILVWRHGLRQLAPAYRLSVALGLVLTFVLGASVGAVLGGMQPPAGPGLPVLGWSTVAGDLRVAHFIGIHAGQVLPMLGAAIVWSRLPAARAMVTISALVWTAVWGLSFAAALAGRPLLG